MREITLDLVGFAFAFSEFGEQASLFGGVVEGGEAVLLELGEEGHVSFDAALAFFMRQRSSAIC